MSRQQLVDALCDLFGYQPMDFTEQTCSDIWWYLQPEEKTAVKEYMEVSREFRVAGIN